MIKVKAVCAVAGILATVVGVVRAQEGMVLSRSEATVAVEPYAANVVRVTLSLRKEEATGKPGYGIIVHSSE